MLRRRQCEAGLVERVGFDGAGGEGGPFRLDRATSGELASFDMDLAARLGAISDIRARGGPAAIGRHVQGEEVRHGPASGVRPDRHCNVPEWHATIARTAGWETGIKKRARRRLAQPWWRWAWPSVSAEAVRP